MFDPSKYNCTWEDLNKCWKSEDLDANVVRENIVLATFELCRLNPYRSTNHLTSAEVNRLIKEISKDL